MIRVFFGNIGCGKTSLAVRNVFKIKKQFEKAVLKGKIPIYYNTYCNFENKVSKCVDLKDLGDTWTFPEYSYVVIDEAGIEYNNRKFKTLSQGFIKWIKLSRHYKCDVDFISQSWDDMDITIRRLAEELWYVKRLGPFTAIRRVYKTVGIDENTKQIIDEYKFGKIIRCILPYPWHQHNLEIFLRKPYYKYFDSYSAPKLEVIDN